MPRSQGEERQGGRRAQASELPGLLPLSPSSLPGGSGHRSVGSLSWPWVAPIPCPHSFPMILTHWTQVPVHSLQSLRCAVRPG